LASNRPKVDAASDLPRGKKGQFYTEGYEIAVAEDVTGGHTNEEQIAHVYGSDDPLTAQHITGGTLSVQVLEKARNNTFLEVLTGNNPDVNTMRAFDLSDLKEIVCWFNIKHPDGDRYCQARLWSGWAPAPGDRSAPPNGWSRTTFTGPCDLEKRFDEAAGVGVYIVSEKLDASSSGAGAGYTATLTNTPVKDQTRSINLVRCAVLVCSQDGTWTSKDEIIIDANTCGDGLTTVWVDNNELDETKSSVTHFFVQYLQTGSGVLPATASIKMDGISKDV
jgi:hypothetical protein